MDEVSVEVHRQIAVDLFNRVWTLMEKAGRTVEDTDAMIHGAHASRHHWGVAGQPVHWARGEWQCSRVYAVLGRGEPALHHAARCLQLVEQHEIGPFDLAFAHEALARAHKVAGDAAACARHVASARAAAEGIEEVEEKNLLFGDLAQLGDGA